METIKLKVADLLRHPIHVRMNIVRTNDELVAHNESIIKHGRQKPIIVQFIEHKGVISPYVLDGWSTVQVALLNGIETLPGVEMSDCSAEDLPELVADIQTGFHRDPEEDYLRFEYFYERYSKGQGHRSDLNNDDLNTWDYENE